MWNFRSLRCVRPALASRNPRDDLLLDWPGLCVCRPLPMPGLIKPETVPESPARRSEAAFALPVRVRPWRANRKKEEPDLRTLLLFYAYSPCSFRSYSPCDFRSYSPCGFALIRRAASLLFTVRLSFFAVRLRSYSQCSKENMPSLVRGGRASRKLLLDLPHRR